MWHQENKNSNILKFGTVSKKTYKDSSKYCKLESVMAQNSCICLSFYLNVNFYALLFWWSYSGFSVHCCFLIMDG